MEDDVATLVHFYQQREEELKQTGLGPLRSDIRLQWNHMATYFNNAKQALDRGDAARANRLLDQTQGCIDFLERAK
jgi:hypothetical protein